MLGERWLYKFALRPKVVHRLPGRVRLHLPILKRVPPDMHGWIHAAAEVIARHDGLEAVEANPLSGSVLLTYRPERLSDDEAVALFNRCIACGVDNLDMLRALPAEERGPCIRRLLEEQPWLGLDKD